MAVAEKSLSKTEIATIYLQREKRHSQFKKDAQGKDTDVVNKLFGEKYYILSYTDDAGKKVTFTADNKRFIKDYDKGQLSNVVLTTETTGTGANAVTYSNLSSHLSFEKKQALALNNIRERRITALESEVAGEKINDFSLRELANFSIS